MTTPRPCPFCGRELAREADHCPTCGAVTASGTHDSGTGGADPGDPLFIELMDELRDALSPGLQIVRPLGRGGMGTVFLARDPALKRNVVVKVLSPSLTSHLNARERFAREAQAAAAVSHPNVISIFQVGELPRSGTSYFVMQHVDGRTLSEEFPGGTTGQEARVRSIVGEVASALSAAHAKGLVHRDVKPANIMVDRESGRAVVLDFGISAVISGGDDGPRSTKLTEEGSSIGTPQYMSPEQAAGEEVTQRSDVYSLGLVAFELLTGRAVFEDDNPMSLIAAHLKDTPPSLRELRPDVDPHFADLVEACLAKAPIERPDARVIADALLPDAGPVLEWPPPGLESIQGAGRAYLNRVRWFAAVELVYITILEISLVGVEDSAIGAALVGMFLGTVVLAAMVAVAFPARRLGQHIRWARTIGFPAGVLLDVVIDGQNDTELLLNRRGPYARLTIDTVRYFMGRRRVHFAAQTGVVVTSMLGPLMALAIGDSDWLLLPLFMLPVGWLGANALIRAERRFRKRYAPSAPSATQSVVSGDVVGAWLSAADREPAPPSRLAPWAVQRVAESLNAVLAIVLLLGVAGVFNWIGVIVEFETNQRGNSAEHLATLRDGRSLAIGGPPALEPGISSGWVPVDAQELAALVAPGTRAEIEAHVSALQVLDIADPFGAAYPDSVMARLEAAAADSRLPAWRSLGGTAVPSNWYVEAVRRAQGADSSSPSYVTCACNRGVQELWQLARLNLAAAVLARERGSNAEAVQRIGENAAAGLKLASDPITVAPGVRVLVGAASSLTGIGRAIGDESVVEHGGRLTGFAERLREAAEVFNGPVATKAFGTLPVLSERREFLDLVGDVELRPVHRWGLIRAVVHGACFGEDLYFGFDREREALFRDAMERMDDLPDADVMGPFLRDFEFERRESQGWRRWVRPLVWSVSRVRACERARILGTDSEAPWDTTRARIE